jgi:hypothetical protein
MITDNNDTKINIDSIKKFLFDNYKQIFLFILVFIIIFLVEYISNINSILYGFTPVPSIGTATKLSKIIIQKNKKTKKAKKN